MRNKKLIAPQASFRLVYYGTCFMISVLVFFTFLQVGINKFQPAAFGKMVYGTAWKPYVYRALVPFIIRTATALVPEETRQAINESIWGKKAFQLLNDKKLRWEKMFLTEFLIGSTVMYLGLVGFFFAFRYFFKTVYEAPDKLLDLTSLAALLGLPVMFKYTSFIYDFGTLFLFTLGLALMARQKWISFLVVYALACFNKETTILLTMLFVIYFNFMPPARLDKPSFLKVLSAQIVIYLIVRAILNYFFYDNPGSFLLDVTGILAKHNLSMAPYSIEAFVYLFIALMVLYKWEEKPLFLKWGLWVLPPLVVLCLFFGFLDELRDYYEAYPIVLLLMAHTMGDITGWKANTRIIASQRWDVGAESNLQQRGHLLFCNQAASPPAITVIRDAPDFPQHLPHRRAQDSDHWSGAWHPAPSRLPAA